MPNGLYMYTIAENHGYTVISNLYGTGYFLQINICLWVFGWFAFFFLLLQERILFKKFTCLKQQMHYILCKMIPVTATRQSVALERVM